MAQWRPSKNRGFYLGPIENTPVVNDLLWADSIRHEQLSVEKIIERERLTKAGLRSDTPNWMKMVNVPKSR